VKRSERLLDERPSGPIPGFVCKPIPGARLTRRACGARHASASNPWEPGSRKTKVWSEACAGCDVGAAHARGETPSKWPDGTPIVNVRLVPLQQPIVRSRPLSRKERRESMRQVG
jgi:hypothetical protein